MRNPDLRHPDLKRHQLLTIRRADRHWTGDWQLTDDGRSVCVRSAYGSATLPLGRRQPDRVAAEALTRMVDQWRGGHAR